MKKLPIVDFDFDADDQTRNLKHLVAMMISVREGGTSWAIVKPLYQKSKYIEFIGWSRLYSAACAEWKKQLPAPVKPEPKAKAEPKPVEVKVDSILPKTAKNRPLLKALIMRDLESENSVILAEIEARINSESK